MFFKLIIHISPIRGVLFSCNLHSLLSNGSYTFAVSPDLTPYDFFLWDYIKVICPNNAAWYHHNDRYYWQAHIAVCVAKTWLSCQCVLCHLGAHIELFFFWHLQNKFLICSGPFHYCMFNSLLAINFFKPLNSLWNILYIAYIKQWKIKVMNGGN